jgi:metal-sulfur cluster biosynthetic enzyme
MTPANGPNPEARPAEATAALWAALHEVEDPEFPMSIVDLGLIVDLKRVGPVVALKITFTAMGCPCIDMILDDVRRRLGQEPGVEQVEIEVVWSPAWSKARLTEPGREIMQWGGVAL